ncbi:MULTISPECIES: hypothetical protein [Oceanobacillus]|uniref:hypothetical protein n=1 Tax=Oceanobacillus TaxID=182709 RepID=UPI0005963581|nr:MULTISPECIES: hypothetical protein [Oceanobacillus]
MKGLDRNKAKTIAIYTAMVLLVLLIIISIIVGWVSNNSDEENEQERADSTENGDLVDDMYRYDEENPNKGIDDVMEEPSPAEEELEQLEEGEIWEELEDPKDGENISEEDMFNEEGPPSYEDIYTEDEIYASQNTTEEFIEIIYNIDGDEPMKFYDEAKDFMTLELYERLEQEYNEGKMTWIYGLNREFESLEIYQPSSMDPSQEKGITWAARIQGVQSIHDGEKEKVTDVYIIRLKEVDGDYIIDDLAINFPT